MVSPKTIQETPRSSLDAPWSPRISFSADFLDEKSLIITPHSPKVKLHASEKEKTRNVDFEFLSSNLGSQTTMITADELFYEGKLLPFWQMHNAEKLNKISLKSDHIAKGGKLEPTNKDDYRKGWFVDDDPSPRPPKCTVLWKELFKLRKQRSSTLSPSSSSSSSSSSSTNLADIVPNNEKKEGSQENKEKTVKKVKKGLERTKSSTIRIRPVVNVPICTQGKNTHALPPLFPFRKARLER
ncbi:hypothetical protein LIER_36547 [Lithospermum erythrorhizon]|uniref:Uncharacterized protein n=1 Tax=Lithospermum erythrorhizon TaxID=34254 RepID=A0AAV3P7D8_LITER